MAGVGYLRSVAGPGSSLAQAGKGGGGAAAFIGGDVYSADATNLPAADFTQYDIVAGDRLFIFIAGEAAPVINDASWSLLIAENPGSTGRTALYIFTKVAEGNEGQIAVGRQSGMTEGFQVATAVVANPGPVVTAIDNTSGVRTPPPITAPENSVVLVVGADRESFNNIDTVGNYPPAGFTYIDADQNAALNDQYAIRLAYAVGVSGPQSPGSWSGWSGGVAHVNATIAVGSNLRS